MAKRQTKAKAKPKAKQKEIMRYVTAIPRTVPAGLILVHNHVQPAHPIGLNGFRAWLATPEAMYEKCKCGWAPDVSGGHYRVRGE